MLTWVRKKSGVTGNGEGNGFVVVGKGKGNGKVKIFGVAGKGNEKYAPSQKYA